ncbi:EcsC family protein [Lacrimispora sp. JR3]|uniref:EcsC family protein n=1 Tax=Lacrimispora sinapis TaxID=3111456 RepID=UPI003748A0CA
MNKNRQFDKQMKRIKKEEENLLKKKENSFYKAAIGPVADKMERFIPGKLKAALETAFYKGFRLVFEKGNFYIEKTYDKDKIQLEYDLNNYALGKRTERKYMKRLDRYSMQSQRINSSISVIEGGVLGALGIGLPDIPLFLSLVLKSVYEIALSYGYNYETQEEKAYILLLIRTAMTKQEKQKEFNQKLEELGACIDSGIVSEIDLEESIKTTSSIFSEALLTAKFIQGIPVVGAVGGIVNYNIIRKISRFAGVKYKKRYYMKEQSWN